MTGTISKPLAGNPYRRLGLIRNPFLAEPVPGVPDTLWVRRPIPDPPAPHGRRLVQVIGVKGAGKTSLLLRWRDAAAGPYHYVPKTPARWQPPPIGPLVYWDELDRLPRPVRLLSLQRAAWRDATVVAGTHADLSAEAATAGLSVTTVRFPALRAEELLQFAALRTRAVTLPGETPRLMLLPNQAAELAASCGGSWRLVADRLHVWAATVARAAAGM